MWQRTLSLLAFLGLSVATTGCCITGALGLSCDECGESCGEPCGDCAPMADFACTAPAVEVCEPACAEACPTCAAPVLESIAPASPTCAAPACSTCAPAVMPMTTPPQVPAPAGMTHQSEPSQTAAAPGIPAPSQPFAAEPYPPSPETDIAPMEVQQAVPTPQTFDMPMDDVNTTSYRPRVIQHRQVTPVQGYRVSGQIRQAGSQIPRRTVSQPTGHSQLPVMRLD